MLGIDFKLRRRSRLNGVVRHSVEGNTLLDVQQCFVNCPKYIQARALRSATLNPIEPHQIASGVRLSEAQINLIHHADTFFIASQHKAEEGRDNRNGIDLSHRGGKPGFVKASDDGSVITWPDFAGNNMFNTLGNISRDPRAGLLFIDYQRGDILSLTGEAEIVWDGSEVEAFAGSERNVRLHVTQWTHLINAYTFDWSEPELSPFLRSTGNW